MGENKGLNLDTYDFPLPEECIAQEPASERDESKLLVYHRKKDIIEHKRFNQIVDYCDSSVAIVKNTSKVIPAKLIGHIEKSKKNIDIVLVEEKKHTAETSVFSVLTKQKKLKKGQQICFAENFSGNVLGFEHDLTFVEFNVTRNQLFEILDKCGFAPLPPYIKRDKNVDTDIREKDLKRYQTVYAKEAGSIAAPTAGLHFTKQLIEQIRAKKTEIETLVLHVGRGTFKPVTDEDVTSHKMLPEWYEIGSRLKMLLDKKTEANKKILSVGTTSTRAIESYIATKNVKAESNMFIYPGHEFFIDMLLTNLHVPRSTPLFLVSAFIADQMRRNGEKEYIEKAAEKLKCIYKEAIHNNYRFYSYGDAMLVI